MSGFSTRILAFAVLFLGGLAGGVTASDVDYLREIKPLLAEKCIGCHGPVKQEASLRLDAARLIRLGGDSGEVASIQAPDDSLLLHRVLEPSDDARMPPKEDGARLTDEQVSLLKRWIAAGMPAPADEEVLESPRDHWAFQPIQRPKLSGPDGVHPIDQLIGAVQQQAGVQPLPAADAVTLLRRVTLDVVGLPPSPSEVLAVSSDPQGWSYEATVDRLLASPQYGERWGRHWMDVWRYSDWDGYKDAVRGSQPHIWRWRDWIVESLNTDKPYDQMLVEMLAGDEIAPEDHSTLRATGFLVRNFHTSNRDIWLDATVEHTMKAFVGLTANCARCHDHKFDPISQTEYFALRAIFEPHRVRTERLPGVADLKKDGLPRVYDADLDTPTYLYERGDEKFPDKENPIAPATVAVLDLPLEIEPITLPAIAVFPSLADHIEKEDLAAAEAERTKARDQLAQVLAKEEQEQEKPKKSTAADTETIDTAPEAGDADSAPQAEDSPKAPPPRVWTEREQAELRLSAAELKVESLQKRWAADRAKFQADPPSQEIRESLAMEAAIAERQYNVVAAEVQQMTKSMALQTAGKIADAAKQKTAVEKAEKELADAGKKLDEARKAIEATDSKYTAVGKSYPRSSTGRRLALARWMTHPQNPLTARVAVNHIWLRHFGKPLVANTFDFGLSSPRPQQAELLDWLASELMDNGWSTRHLHRLILTSDAYQRASSGDHGIEMQNVRIDPDNHMLWRGNINRLDAEVVRDCMVAVANRLDLTPGGPDIDFAEGEKVLRRSLYFRHAYEKQMTMLVLFDAPSPSECYQRSDSITPQQALVLSNSELSRSMARQLARELSTTHGSPADFVQAAFVQVLSRLPRPEESDACQTFLSQQAGVLASDEKRTTFTGGGKSTTPPAEDPGLRARENLVHVLMNHNDFVTVR